MAEKTLERSTLKQTGTGRPSRNGGAAERDETGSTFRQRMADPAYQAYFLLRLTFVVAPIAFGLDKFTNVLVDWEVYLAPWINDIVPGTAATAMYIVGGVEILAGILIALKPRYAAYVVAAWLAGIIVNLLTLSGYYDVALRDFGLLMGALALARLARKFDPPGFNVRF